MVSENTYIAALTPRDRFTLHVLFFVVLLEGSGEVGLLLEVFGDNWDGGVPQLDVIKEPLPERLDPQIVLLHTYTTDTVH